MRTFDFTPLYRSTIGFDHLSSLLDSLGRNEGGSGYPPCNIELLEKDRYQITMAVAGYTPEDLDLQAERQTLTIRGRKTDAEDGKRNYLHQGIAARSFERRFQLADHVEVTGARLENGLLHIDLVRELPEAMKPRTIPISNGKGRLIDVEGSERAEAAEKAA